MVEGGPDQAHRPGHVREDLIPKSYCQIWMIGEEEGVLGVRKFEDMPRAVDQIFTESSLHTNFSDDCLCEISNVSGGVLLHPLGRPTGA